MSTGTIIIQDSLSNIGAHSVIRPAGPESISIGLRRLTGMMELWLSDSILLGVTPLVAPGDELNEPTDATQVIINKLSIELSPLFNNGKQVTTPEVRLNAKLGFATIKKLYQTVTIPCKRVSGTLPRGEGGTRGRNSRTFFIGNRRLP